MIGSVMLCKCGHEREAHLPLDAAPRTPLEAAIVGSVLGRGRCLDWRWSDAHRDYVGCSCESFSAPDPESHGERRS